MLETIVLEWSLDMCIILILASTEDLNEKGDLSLTKIWRRNIDVKKWGQVINKDGNGKSQTQTSSFLLKLICSASNVLLNGSVALKISSTESYHCCLFTTLNINRISGWEIQKSMQDSDTEDSELCWLSESELFFLRILSSEGFEDSEWILWRDIEKGHYRRK